VILKEHAVPTGLSGLSVFAHCVDGKVWRVDQLQITVVVYRSHFSYSFGNFLPVSLYWKNFDCFGKPLLDCLMFRFRR
jgi:hypothetical protein